MVVGNNSHSSINLYSMLLVEVIFYQLYQIICDCGISILRDERKFEVTVSNYCKGLLIFACNSYHHNGHDDDDHTVVYYRRMIHLIKKLLDKLFDVWKRVLKDNETDNNKSNNRHEKPFFYQLSFNQLCFDSLTTALFNSNQCIHNKESSIFVSDCKGLLSYISHEKGPNLIHLMVAMSQVNDEVISLAVKNVVNIIDTVKSVLDEKNTLSTLEDVLARQSTKTQHHACIVETYFEILQLCPFNGLTLDIRDEDSINRTADKTKDQYLVEILRSCRENNSFLKRLCQLIHIIEKLQKSIQSIETALSLSSTISNSNNSNNLVSLIIQAAYQQSFVYVKCIMSCFIHKNRNEHGTAEAIVMCDLNVDLHNILKGVQGYMNMKFHQNIRLLDTTFSGLLQIPELYQYVSFPVKQKYLSLQIKRLKRPMKLENMTREQLIAEHFIHPSDPIEKINDLEEMEDDPEEISLAIDRDRVLEQSFQCFQELTPRALIRGSFDIMFDDEQGTDAGGLTREWLMILTRSIFKPSYALFSLTSDGVTYQPNYLSGANPEHLQYFHFIGRLFAKVICDQRLLDVHVTKSLYKHILGSPVGFEDLESLDPSLYSSLKTLLDSSIEQLGLEDSFTFETTSHAFGQQLQQELVPNGKQIIVNDNNKHEYVNLVARHYLSSSIQIQVR